MTPKKARIQGTCDFLDAKGIFYSHNDIFRFHRVCKTSGWKALRESRDFDSRTFHSTFAETRGRKKKLSQNDLKRLEQFLESNGFDGRTITWDSLPAAAGLDVEVSGETVRRALKTIGFRRCIACQKAWVSKDLADRRKAYAQTMLDRYPNKEDWRHVRFSDETHFGWGPQGKIYVIRRPWERACPDCVDEKEGPQEKDQKRLHAWAAVGYNFKSNLNWYDVPSNNNGKMTLKVYRDKILEPIVGNWLREGHSFVLEEDNDSGHGTGKANIVRTWKRENSLTSFFNCSESPDFVPIEKAFQAPKQSVRKRPCWDDAVVRELAEEGWEALKQSTINKWVDEIPKILEACIQSEGKMTAY